MPISLDEARREENKPQENRGADFASVTLSGSNEWTGNRLPSDPQTLLFKQVSVHGLLGCPTLLSATRHKYEQFPPFTPKCSSLDDELQSPYSALRFAFFLL